MIEYIIKRVLLFIPTLFLITVITFAISRLAPGDPAEMKAGVGAEGTMSAGGKNAVNEEIIKLIREQWHLDQPLWKQYTIWVSDLAVLDFGRSFIDRRPVMEKIWERVPVTAGLNIVSVILSLSIAIPIGIYSATHQYTRWDKVSTFVLFILNSLPSFWIATMAVIFLCGGDFFAVFPSNGLHSMDYSPNWPIWDKLIDTAWHVFLPLVMISYGALAFESRQMRGAMLEVIRQDYIRTARAKGLSERVVVYKHAFRNSLIPILTLMAGLIPGLIGGAIITESIFSIPGMGQLALQALLSRDYPVIMAEFTISAGLSMLGILLADIGYSLVDPRIVFTRKSA
jgi:peptide/nickel transport system permease protein